MVGSNTVANSVFGECEKEEPGKEVLNIRLYTLSSRTMEIRHL